MITRVYNMFKGHSHLMVGFNTFLPPGIEIVMNNNFLNISIYKPGQEIISLYMLYQHLRNANLQTIHSFAEFDQ